MYTAAQKGKGGKRTVHKVIDNLAKDWKEELTDQMIEVARQRVEFQRTLQDAANRAANAGLADNQIEREAAAARERRSNDATIRAVTPLPENESQPSSTENSPPPPNAHTRADAERWWHEYLAGVAELKKDTDPRVAQVGRHLKAHAEWYLADAAHADVHIHHGEVTATRLCERLQRRVAALVLDDEGISLATNLKAEALTLSIAYVGSLETRDVWTLGRDILRALTSFGRPVWSAMFRAQFTVDRVITFRYRKTVVLGYLFG
ncbi:hypothetical protein HDU90_002758 [Geranomyces variabilis]|nr:hypothetical protein HDU90_002758 [Geranomyces variabilis]